MVLLLAMLSACMDIHIYEQKLPSSLSARFFSGVQTRSGRRVSYCAVDHCLHKLGVVPHWAGLLGGASLWYSSLPSHGSGQTDASSQVLGFRV